MRQPSKAVKHDHGGQRTQPLQSETLILRPAIPSLVTLLLRALGKGTEALRVRLIKLVALNQFLVASDIFQVEDRDRTGCPVSALA